MLVGTETTLALRCPDCGRLGLYTISRFDFCREKVKEIVCPCGAVALVMSTRNHKAYWLEIGCAVCEAMHLFRFSPHELFTPDVTHILCQESELELAHVGSRDRIEQYVKNRTEALEALVEEMGGSDYFSNAEVMLGTLTHVHVLAEEGNLVCPCGKSRIELEIFPDRLELHCRNCQRFRIFYAQTERDLDRLTRLNSIELTRQVLVGRKKHRKRDKHRR
ncbi:MAG: hypothetical protein ACUVRC_01310 [Desulfotomaculales bacterium]